MRACEQRPDDRQAPPAALRLCVLILRSRAMWSSGQGDGTKLSAGSEEGNVLFAKLEVWIVCLQYCTLHKSSKDPGAEDSRMRDPEQDQNYSYEQCCIVRR